MNVPLVSKFIRTNARTNIQNVFTGTIAKDLWTRSLDKYKSTTKFIAAIIKRTTHDVRFVVYGTYIVLLEKRKEKIKKRKARKSKSCLPVFAITHTAT